MPASAVWSGSSSRRIADFCPAAGDRAGGEGRTRRRACGSPGWWRASSSSGSWWSPSRSDSDPQAAADPDYAAGRRAIEARNWNAAIKSFSSAALRAPDNADIQNYLGYAHRKAGQLDSAFRHYKRALELNPRHRGAHEYIGEVYLMAGDLANARKHLEELRKICLLPCKELNDLGKAIAEYRGTPRTGPR
jgi:tetratricopeptide (TPR) repeat protein